MAIDNVLPNSKSQEEASSYLSHKFPKGSKIFITSKSESILTNLASLHNQSFSFTIEYMPALILEEARDIFVHEFPELHDGFSDVEDGVNKCVEMCTIHKMRYHPLMLKSLAASLKWGNRWIVPNWKERLIKFGQEGITKKTDAWEKVFNVFDKAYALLSEEEKRVFLDLALFFNATGQYCFEIIKWIKSLHPHLCNKEMDQIVCKVIFVHKV